MSQYDEPNIHTTENDLVLLAEARNAITDGDVLTADRILNKIPDRTAEWHYLYALVLTNKGWFDKARFHFKEAMDMEPNHPEYAQGMENLNNRAKSYSEGYRKTVTTPNIDPCTCCGDLICMDCFCECMGGDLIPCC